MKESLFIDSDVILDVALNREPHFIYSATVLTLIENLKIEAYTSVLIVNNVYYILKKIENHNKAIHFIRKLKLLIKLLPVDEEIVQQALDSKFDDFEDAIQYFVAGKSKLIGTIITRNTKDYKKSAIKVHTPEEYLKMRNIRILKDRKKR